MHAEDITSTSIIAAVTLESEGSYSIGIDDASALEEGDMRYITGLSEGHEFGPGRLDRGPADRGSSRAEAIGVAKQRGQDCGLSDFELRPTVLDGVILKGPVGRHLVTPSYLGGIPGVQHRGKTALLFLYEAR